MTKPPLAYAGLVSGRDPNVRGTANDERRNLDAFHRCRLPCGLDRDGSGMSDFVAKYWPALLPIIGFIVWLVRLEGRALAIEKELERMAAQREEDLANAAKSREDQKETLNDIKDDMKTIRQDIKTLLARHN